MLDRLYDGRVSGLSRPGGNDGGIKLGHLFSCMGGPFLGVSSDVIIRCPKW